MKHLTFNVNFNILKLLYLKKKMINFIHNRHYLKRFQVIVNNINIVGYVLMVGIRWISLCSIFVFICAIKNKGDIRFLRFIYSFYATFNINIRKSYSLKTAFISVCHIWTKLFVYIGYVFANLFKNWDEAAQEEKQNSAQISEDASDRKSVV